MCLLAEAEWHTEPRPTIPLLESSKVFRQKTYKPTHMHIKVQLVDLRDFQRSCLKPDVLARACAVMSEVESDESRGPQKLDMSPGDIIKTHFTNTNKQIVACQREKF